MNLQRKYFKEMLFIINKILISGNFLNTLLIKVVINRLNGSSPKKGKYESNISTGIFFNTNFVKCIYSFADKI